MLPRMQESRESSKAPSIPVSPPSPEPGSAPLPPSSPGPRSTRFSPSSPEPVEGRGPARRRAAGALGCLLLAAAVLVPTAALVPSAAGVPAGDEPAAAEPEPLVGVVSREQVEAAVPAWVQAEIEAEPDAEAARHLLAVEPGAEVTVYFGTWCSDSRRELARLWRAFDEVGAGFGAELPFAIEYVAVDRDKRQPAERLAGVDVEYVPTFVVRRDGREVGRMVEVSPHGIEADLLALLSGEAAGVVSARDDLGGAGDAAADAVSHPGAGSASGSGR